MLSTKKRPAINREDPESGQPFVDSKRKRVGPSSCQSSLSNDENENENENKDEFIQQCDYNHRPLFKLKKK